MTHIHIPLRVSALLALLAAVASGVILGIQLAPPANACDPGNWYDPTHQVCAPYPPAYPPTNYPAPSNNPYPPSQWGQQ
jgi:hypothetical protein